MLLLLSFLPFSVLFANPKKLLYTVTNPARGLLNREQRTKRESLAAPPPPPPPRCSNCTVLYCTEGGGKHRARTMKKKKNRLSEGHHHVTHLHAKYAVRGSRSVSRPHRIPSARRLGQLVLFRRFYAFVYDNNFPSHSIVASLFSWRCLAASTSCFLHAAINLRPPFLTVSTHTSASDAVAFPTPRYTKRPDVALYAIGPLFLLATRPLRTAPSRFPNMIRFGNRPPHIRMSAPAHKSLLVRHVFSMFSHRVISKARLYEVIRWSGLLCCAPMVRRKTQW